MIPMEMQMRSSHTNIIFKYINRRRGVIRLFLFMAITSSCVDRSDRLELTGNLEPLGLTSFQYGSHQLISEDSSFALRSSSIDLTKYEFKRVHIVGVKVDGYPIENGPLLIEIKSIKLTDKK